MYYGLVKKAPSRDYISDTINYLQRPEAALFSFHKVCLDPFFDVVKFYWGEYSASTRINIKKAIRSKYWVKKSSQSARDILGLV